MMRNVLVTGGSRGLGLGICRQLSSVGYRVLAVARTRNDHLTSAIEEAELANPGSFKFIPFDLSDIEGIPHWVAKVRKEFGPIYGLVNNAGISFDGALALMHTSKIEQMFRVNALSPIVLTKHVVRSMMAQSCGRIVNISSVTAFSGHSGLSVYGATKASMLGFTRSLAREVGRMGVNVNSVAPGFVDTDLTHGLSEEQRQQIARRTALRRLTSVVDVANAVEFLLSDKAINITGTVLTVDAGSTA
jgi:3-oxoacyl-[acyl-carrier protein] reductase